ncbi:unnamed protein product [Caretta caretta]
MKTGVEVLEQRNENRNQESLENWDDYVKNWKAQMREAFELGNKNSRKSVARNKSFCDCRGHPRRSDLQVSLCLRRIEPEFEACYKSMHKRQT